MKNPLRRAAMAAVPALLLSACQVEIQHQLSEGEANEIVVLLERSRIPARKDKEEGGRELTWKISVPKAHAANSMILLKENELPRPKSAGLEIFNRGSLIPTATEERAMFLQALAGELSRTISSINGILDARVHVNLPQSDDLADRSERPEPSAAVLVKYRAPEDEDGKKAGPPIGAEQIQQLVSKAVQDLKPANVSVVMVPGAPPGGLTVGPGDVDVLGIRMAADSVGAFRAVLATLVVIILLLAGYIVFSKTRELRGPSRAPRPRPEA